MALREHLRELRSRLIKSVLAIGVGLVICYLFYDSILTLLTEPFCRTTLGQETDCELQLTGALAAFGLRLRVALYGGLLFAVPVILWQTWRFIAPGLYKKERRYAVAFVSVSTLLFALGAALAYYTLPKMLSFLYSEAGPAERIEQFQYLDDYIHMLVLLMIGFGIGFLFPVVLVALQLIGVLEYKTLTGLRRHAVVGIVIVVAMITPGGDPISLMALSVPMYLFYEASIGIGWFVDRRARRRAAAA